MAKTPKKPPAGPAAVAKKAAKDVVSQAVDASNAKVADLESSVQIVAGMTSAAAPMDRSVAPLPTTAQTPKAQRKGQPKAAPATAAPAMKAAPAVVAPREPIAENPEAPQTSGLPGASLKAATPEGMEAPVVGAEPEALVEPSVEDGPAGDAERIEYSPAAAVAPVDELSAVPALRAEELAPPKPPLPTDDTPAVAATSSAPPSPPQSGVAPEPRAETAEASDAIGSLHINMGTLADGWAALNAKALEALRTNAGMTFDLIKSLIGATNLADAFSIHTDHARRRFEMMSVQARELQCLAAKVTAEAVVPSRRM